MGRLRQIAPKPPPVHLKWKVIDANTRAPFTNPLWLRTITAFNSPPQKDVTIVQCGRRWLNCGDFQAPLPAAVGEGLAVHNGPAIYLPP